MIDFAAEYRQRRDALSLTDNAVAVRAGVSAETVRRFARGAQPMNSDYLARVLAVVGAGSFPGPLAPRGRSTGRASRESAPPRPAL